MWKQVVFGLAVTMLFFAALELALAVCGVEPVLARRDPFVGFVSRVPLFVEESGAGGRVLMHTADNKRALFNEQSFPREKAEGTFRIFCLGGSTTYGRPYDDRTSFCGWLREMLPAADPSREWEVINAGGISYASYRVRLLMEELVDYEPDLFIVYTGHNEFLEERTYGDLRDTASVLPLVQAWASQTRTYALLRSIKGRFEPATDDAAAEVDAGDSGRFVLPAEVAAVLDGSVGPTEYERDDVLRDHIVDHYRLTVEHMIQIARSAGVEIVFVKPASNLKDCSPFESQHVESFGGRELEAWDEAFARGRAAQRAGHWDEALAAYDEAAAIEHRHAELHFRRGEVLLELGRHDGAQAAFVQAREEDICPLRALTPTLEALEQVTAAWDVPLVDFAALVEARARAELGHGIPGEEQFLDHVHPTIEMHRRLALELVDALADRGIVKPQPSWGEEAAAGVARRVEAGLDEEYGARSLVNLARVLAWAGKTDEARRPARQALQVLGEDAEALLMLGLLVGVEGDREEAFDYVRRALVADPSVPETHFQMGRMLAAQGEQRAALGYYLMATRLRPNLAAAQYELAATFEALGHREQAAATYRECLRVHPGYDEAQRDLERLLSELGEDAPSEDARPRPVHASFYPGGGTRALAQVREGGGDPVMHGFCTLWSDEGLLTDVWQCRDGEVHGTWVSWHPGGGRSRRMEFRDGRKHGVEIHWDEAGREVSRTTYRQGRPVEE